MAIPDFSRKGLVPKIKKGGIKSNKIHFSDVVPAILDERQKSE